MFGAPAARYDPSSSVASTGGGAADGWGRAIGARLSTLAHSGVSVGQHVGGGLRDRFFSSSSSSANLASMASGSTHGGSGSSSSGGGSVGGKSFLGVRIPPGRGCAFSVPLASCAKLSETATSVAEDDDDPVVGLDVRNNVPAIAYRCLVHLERWGVREEGIYRVPGASNDVALLRALFDAGEDVDLAQYSPGDLDPHAVASVFKLWLRERTSAA